jgi:hypothetical protein
MVDNQHQKIKGYRDLTEQEIKIINACKEGAKGIGVLVEVIGEQPGVDKRWLAIAQTDLQKGFMALVRSVARPETF